MRLLDERLAQPSPIGEIYTAQDLEQIPSDERYELVRGELCAMPNNSAEHGNKTMRLSAPIALFVEQG
jgi:Uma2 family endonuclease